MNAFLATFVVLGSGAVAGVLFAVARAVVPTFARLPGDQYVRLHQMLDPRFDPFMPWITRGVLVASAVLAFTSDPLEAKILFGVGHALSALVAVVSEVWNVRMNRRVLTWDPAKPPREWRAVRARWATANTWRTAFAGLAFGVYTAGMVSLA